MFLANMVSESVLEFVKAYSLLLRIGIELAIIFLVFHFVRKGTSKPKNLILTEQEIDKMVEEFKPKPIIEIETIEELHCDYNECNINSKNVRKHLNKIIGPNNLKEFGQIGPSNYNFHSSLSSRVTEKKDPQKLILHKRCEIEEHSKIDDITPAKILECADYDFYSVQNDNKAELKHCLKQYGVGTCGPPGFYGTLDMHLMLERMAVEQYGMDKTVQRIMINNSDFISREGNVTSFRNPEYPKNASKPVSNLSNSKDSIIYKAENGPHNPIKSQNPLNSDKTCNIDDVSHNDHSKIRAYIDLINLPEQKCFFDHILFQNIPLTGSCTIPVAPSHMTQAMLYSNYLTATTSLIECFCKNSDLIFYHKDCHESIIRGIGITRAKAIALTDVWDIFRYFFGPFEFQIPNDEFPLQNSCDQGEEEKLINEQEIFNDNTRLSNQKKTKNKIFSGFNVTSKHLEMRRKTMKYSRVFFISESVFRNTGRVLDINSLFIIKIFVPFYLILDESMAIPMLGKDGMFEDIDLWKIEQIKNQFLSSYHFFTLNDSTFLETYTFNKKKSTFQEKNVGLKLNQSEIDADLRTKASILNDIFADLTLLQQNFYNLVDIRLISLSHAFCSMGGLVLANQHIIDYQLLLSASYCFSASMPGYLAMFAWLLLQYKIRKPELSKNVDSKDLNKQKLRDKKCEKEIINLYNTQHIKSAFKSSDWKIISSDRLPMIILQLTVNGRRKFLQEKMTSVNCSILSSYSGEKTEKMSAGFEDKNNKHETQSPTGSSAGSNSNVICSKDITFSGLNMASSDKNMKSLKNKTNYKKNFPLKVDISENLAANINSSQISYDLDDQDTDKVSKIVEKNSELAIINPYTSCRHSRLKKYKMDNGLLNIDEHRHINTHDNIQIKDEKENKNKNYSVSESKRQLGDNGNKLEDQKMQIGHKATSEKNTHSESNIINEKSDSDEIHSDPKTILEPKQKTVKELTLSQDHTSLSDKETKLKRESNIKEHLENIDKKTRVQSILSPNVSTIHENELLNDIIFDNKQSKTDLYSNNEKTLNLEAHDLRYHSEMKQTESKNHKKYHMKSNTNNAVCKNINKDQNPLKTTPEVPVQDYHYNSDVISSSIEKNQILFDSTVHLTKIFHELDFYTPSGIPTKPHCREMDMDKQALELIFLHHMVKRFEMNGMRVGMVYHPAGLRINVKGDMNQHDILEIMEKVLE